MGDTTIEWTDKTWNPVTGCTKVSLGCKFCYAERVFPRAYSKTGRTFTDVLCHPERLDQPLHWRKPARIFVNSMSDLFHEDVPDQFILDIYRTMGAAFQHTYQILTKRPERALRLYPWLSAQLNAEGRAKLTTATWKHVWLGVSVENQDTLHRIDTLKDIPSAVRFVSFEPLLEHLGSVILDGIHWAILGSESGHKSRNYSTTWFESLVRQCEEQNVACFVKQLTCGGKKIPFEEWPGYLKVREWPKQSPAIPL